MTHPQRRHTDRQYTTFLGVLVLLVSLFIIAGVAQADDIIAEAGMTLVLPDEGDTSASFVFRGGYKFAYLTWETMEDDELFVLGQQIAKTEVDLFGVGFRYPMDNFEVFVEAGVADLDTKLYGPASTEVSYTYLVGRHDVGDRRIPLPCAYHGCYDTKWDIEDTPPFASVGFAWAPVDHVKVQAKYTYLKPEYYVSVRNDEYNPNGYWEENGNHFDMSFASVGVILFW